MTDFRINVVVRTTGVNVVNKELDQIDKKGDSLGRTLRNAFAFLGGALLVRELIELSDAFTNVQNRLRIVTSGVDGLNEATEELLRISNDTRVSFTATAELYTRTALAVRELGRSQEETLQFTESLNQAVILSGASAQEAQAGLIQLSQGLASGALRGDELRSVLEQLPVVADVIAKSMGVTRGELRELGKEGEITAEVILDAFKAARRELEGNFAKTVPTIGQSFTVLKNNLIVLVGGFQDTSSSLSELILIVADAVEHFDDLLGILTNLGGVGKKVRESLHEIRVGLDEIDEAIAITEKSTATVGGTLENLGEQAKRLEKLLSIDPDNELAKIKLEEVELRMKRLEVSSGLADTKIANLTKTADKLRTALQVDPSRTDLAEKLAQVEEKLGLVKDTVAEFPDLAKAVAPPELSEALQGILDNLAAEAELLKKTNAERAVAAELAKIEKELAKEKLELTPDEEKALEIKLAEQRLLREKADILNELRGPEEERAEREKLVAELLAERLITEAESVELLKEKKEAEEDLNAQDIIDSLKEQVELAKLSNEEQRVQNELLSIKAALKRDEASLTPQEEAQVETLLREVEVTQALTDLRERLNGTTLDAADIQALYNQALEDGVVTAEEMAAILEKIRQRSEEVGEVLPRQASLAEDALKSLALNGIDAAFDALDEFLKTGEFDFKEFAQTLISESLKIIARLLLIKALQSAFGDFGGAVGGAIDTGANSLRADGGRVTAGQDYIVGEEGPERFHPDSSGTIIPADATASMLNQPASAPTVVQAPAPEVRVSVVNVTDPKEALGALSTPDGEKAILNVLQKNRRGARQILA